MIIFRRGGYIFKGLQRSDNHRTYRHKGTYPGGQKASIMLEQISGNISTLDDIISKMDEIKENCGGLCQRMVFHHGWQTWSAITRISIMITPDRIRATRRMIPGREGR